MKNDAQEMATVAAVNMIAEMVELEETQLALIGGGVGEVVIA